MNRISRIMMAMILAILGVVSLLFLWVRYASKTEIPEEAVETPVSQPPPSTPTPEIPEEAVETPVSQPPPST
ncbi:MAG: hypothetical protein ACUVQ0_02690, partial [Thermoproteota archaeon]